ncbi:MAG: hypothetical protein AB7P49_04110 [Bdellovibrionales bacterium]
MKTVEKARTLQGLVRILEKAHLVNELVAHPSLDQKFKQYVHAKKRNGATIAEDKRAIFYSSDANFDVYAIFFNKDGSKNKDTEKIVNRAKRIVQALRILKNGHSYRQFIEHPSMNEKYEQFIKTKAENDTPLDAKKTILSATDDIDADAVFENKTNIFKDGDFDIHGVFYDSSGNLNPAIWDLVNATRKKWMKNPYKKQKIAKD